MNHVDERVSTADLVAAGEAGQPVAEPLLPGDFVHDLCVRWDQVQTEFVDEPRTSVQEADELVALAIKKLAENFAIARQNLERQWGRGEDVSTEDLRIALQKYRAFFHRLLAI